MTKFAIIWQNNRLRGSIIFVLLMFAVFRLGANIPVPGIDAQALRDFFSSNEYLGILNVFSGGGLRSFSIMMLGIGPYITSSIIFQLLTIVIPRLERMQKEEGEIGRKRINRYTRWATVPIAMLQAYGFISLIKKQIAVNALQSIQGWELFWTMIVVTAGTVFLMWLGELITEKKIGNGLSLLIFAGILASIPSIIQQMVLLYDPSQIVNYALLITAFIAVVVGVVFITEGQREIPIQYARHTRGLMIGDKVRTNLPLRVNIAGVIPIIFAISVMIFPSIIAQFFLSAPTPWLAALAQKVITLFRDNTFYSSLYFILVVLFTYFYTSIVFNPKEVADNLQKQGAFVVGVRPGEETVNYLRKVVFRITFAGAMFLGILAVLPILVRPVNASISGIIGGTSLLIVVQVILESMRQIDAQLVHSEYDKL
jgi:preprotein translocase subunit SecY